MRDWGRYFSTQDGTARARDGRRSEGARGGDWFIDGERAGESCGFENLGFEGRCTTVKPGVGPTVSLPPANQLYSPAVRYDSLTCGTRWLTAGAYG